MLTKEQKKEFVKNLRAKIKKNKLAVFCNFERISSPRQQELKKEFQKIGGEIFVAKRRLLEKALSKENIQFPEIIGPTLIGLAPDDILPAKTLKSFPQKKEKIEFIGGILKENHIYTILTKEDLKELALLPTKGELLSNFVRVLQSPIYNFYSILNGNIKKLGYILANIRGE